MSNLKSRAILVNTLLMVSFMAQAQTIVVTNQNFRAQKWEKDQVNVNQSPPPANITTPNTSYVTISCKPMANPPSKRGSIHMFLPSSRETSLRRVRLRNAAFHGVFLKDIAVQIDPRHELKYSTYIVKNINHAAPAMALQIDNDLNGSVDYNIFFDPKIQQELGMAGANTIFPEVTVQRWQEWNASAGWWQINAPPAGTRSELLTPFTLATYLNYFPKATLINTTTGANPGGAIRFTVGIENPDHADFDGYIDLFKIRKQGARKTVTYDFKTTENCPNQ